MSRTVVREQELSNLLMEKNYLKAIALAITLEQPLRVLNITKGACLSEFHCLCHLWQGFCFHCHFFCFFVCLLAVWFKMLWTNFDAILGIDRLWTIDGLLKFWRLSYVLLVDRAVVS